MTPRELRERREALGFTQAQLAQALGVDVMTVSRWERGKHPISETAARLLRVLTPEPPAKRGKRKRR